MNIQMPYIEPWAVQKCRPTRFKTDNRKFSLKRVREQIQQQQQQQNELSEIKILQVINRKE
jgi:hypothetical protein